MQRTVNQNSPAGQALPLATIAVTRNQSDYHLRISASEDIEFEAHLARLKFQIPYEQRSWDEVKRQWTISADAELLLIHYLREAESDGAIIKYGPSAWRLRREAKSQ